MKLSRVRVVFSLVLFALPMSPTLVAGCASHDTAADSADTGEANVGVATQAASTADVTKVTLTVSGPGISKSIVKDLKYVNGQWTGKLSGIPVGDDRVFLAEAYDATNTVLYTGEASGVTITKGDTASVALVLQQKTPPNPFANGAPQISSLVASAGEATPGAPVELAVVATDPDNDALTYAWTATGGSLANAGTATPVWTAPLTDGTQTLSVSVTDGKGGQAGMSVQLKTTSKGSAEVSTTFNNWPVVTQVVATPGQLQPGDSSSLTVTATDVDGDALAYAWSDSCGGSFSSTLAEAPTWTAPATMPSGGTCTLTVVVSDGRGGSTSGSLLIGINLPDANLPPVIDQDYQSADSVSGGEAVSLWVSAHDPEGAALAFSWTSSGGTAGTASTTESSSEIMWAAPTAPGTYNIAATVTDASGLTTTRTFSVAVASSVPLGNPMDVFVIGIKSGASDNELIRIDKDGNQLWQTTVPVSGYQPSAESVDRNLTEDSLYLTDASSSGNPSGFKLLKLNGGGSLEWQRDVSSSYATISANPVSGGVYAADQNGVTRIAADGTTVWGPLSWGHTDAKFVSADPVTGGVFVSTGDAGGNVIKVDASGAKIWEVSVPGVFLVHANGFDGGVYVTSGIYSYTQQTISRFDSGGNIAWSTTGLSNYNYGFFADPTDGTSVVGSGWPFVMQRFSANGELAATNNNYGEFQIAPDIETGGFYGSASSGASYTNLPVRRFDRNLQLIWEKPIGHAEWSRYMIVLTGVLAK